MPVSTIDFTDPYGLKKARPRTGAVGVPNQGGITGPAAPSVQPPVNPTVSTNEPGRPSLGAAAVSSGAGAAPQPQAPQPQPARPASPASAPAGSGVTINIGGTGQPQTATPASASTSPTSPAQPGGAPAQPPVGAPPGAGVQTGVAPRPTFTKIPTDAELELTPPGDYDIPEAGTLTVGADGTRRVRLNEAGARSYQAAVSNRLKSYGTVPFANDPNAPRPPIIPGRPAYNPLDDRWS